MSWNDLLGLDQRASQRLRMIPEKSAWFRVAAFLAHSGDSWFWLAGLGLVWLLGDPEWRLRTSFLIIGMIVLAVIVLAIKFTVRRRRPEGEWGAIYRNTDPHSFPSGHASRATMLAVMAVGAGPFWLAIVLVIWAPLVSLARVLTGVHYVSDVLAGIVVGLIMGALMLAMQPWVNQVLTTILSGLGLL
ncbi:MAG TPA: phosphatase PAP2 family protein [Anaerolineaceae bacterium]|nr:phosphatase PAP2 family protein [Anaerolineaceae bacterium]